VKFSNPSSENNFEALFNITQGKDSGYLDPLSSSLFNVQSLKKIIDIGEKSINIMDKDHKDTSFEDAI